MFSRVERVDHVVVFFFSRVERVDHVEVSYMYFILAVST